MAPEAIRRRMAHGNIYPAERVDAALANYFRPGNLGALRELALLWVADRVEESLTALPRRPRHLRRVGDPRTCRRRAHRLPERRGGDPSRRSDGGPRRRRTDRRPRRGRATGSSSQNDAGAGRRNASWSSNSVATVHDVVAHNTAEGMAAFARQEKATQIVLGASRRSRWHELVHGSFVARLTRLVPEIDVHVIARDRATRCPSTHRSRRREPVRRRTIVAWLLTVGRAAAADRRHRAVPRHVGALDRTPARARRGAGDRRARWRRRGHRGGRRWRRCSSTGSSSSRTRR